MVAQVQVTFDAADPAGLAAFCRQVLGYRSGGREVSRDQRPARVDAEVERLVRAGATKVGGPQRARPVLGRHAGPRGER